MDLKIKGKTAIVTGAGRGIGFATAQTLAKEGVNVVVNDLDPALGEQAAKEIQQLGVQSLSIPGNVSKEEDVANLFAQTYRTFGHIDILINNAGISPKQKFEDITPDDWDNVISVNLRSNYLCCHAAIPYLKENGWGRIVSLSSLAGVYGATKSSVHYSATKAGIIGMTKTLSKTLGQYNITVNCVAPGRIDTAMSRALPPEVLADVVRQIPLKRQGTAQEVANVIVFLASEGGSYITGTCVEILGGYIGGM